jgi:uracil-DNA glycosylase family 4
VGLFFTDAGAAARKGTQAARTPRVRVSEAQRHLLTCQQCPLNHAPLKHAKMPPTGAAQPVFYFMGEAPGEDEDETGEQFVGKAGTFLRGCIPSKYARSIRWSNVIRCRPTDGKKNREPAHMEIQCCTRLQIGDIEQTKPQIIVGFGNVPLKWFLGEEDRQITNWRGRKVPVKIGNHTCWFYPMVHPSWVLRNEHDKKRGEAIVRMFERDLARIFSDHEAGLSDPFVEDPKDYMKGIETIQEYGKQGLQRIEDALVFFHDKDHAVDIETTGLRPYNKDSQILTLAVGTYDKTVAFPFWHPEARWNPAERKTIHDLLYAYLCGPGKKWAHSLKFEQEWFLRFFGPDILYKTEWGDTLGQAHFIDEREGKSLDALVHLYFGFRLKALSNLDKANMAREPLSKVLPYNALDTKYTDALSWVQADVLERLGLTSVYEFVNSATPSFVQMQAKGLVRNVPAITQLVKDLEAERQRLYNKIMQNPDICAYGKSFSPTSNDDLAAFFRDFLKLPNPKNKEGDFEEGKINPKQKYSVDEEVLSQFDHPVASLVLEMRTVNVNKNTFVIPLMDPGTHEHKGCGKHVHGDGLIHASYSPYITVSGRSSCSDPNCQNYPRREHKEIRSVVGIPKGHKLVAFDYGQLEWRIGAELSGDRQMIKEIWGGQDVHGHWTDSIGARFVAALLKANRKKVRDSIKQYWTFANLYGQMLSGLAWDLSQEFKVRISERDLEPFFTAFWNLYPELKAYQDGLISIYKAEGRVENFMGQRRHEPCARTEIINHPFQGSAGQLVINAQGRICRFAYEEDRPSLIPVMNIHDDLTFYFPDASLEEDIETVARMMVTDTFCEKVPMLVEVSLAENNWADKQEIAAFTINQKQELIEVGK